MKDPSLPTAPSRRASEVGAPIEIANEYALVRVREVLTGNGRRLEIHAPRLGRTIRLCPLELEALTWQDHDTFSGFLETPFGPES